MLYQVVVFYVVNSGFNVQTTPSTTNGIDMIPIMPSMVLNCDSDTRGLFIIHGNGNVMITQMTPNNMINLAFAFLFIMYVDGL